jgi:proton-translocating NADH-quinone oxidoreductase chain L
MQLLILFLPLLLFVSISSSRKFISQDNIIRLTLLANTCALVLVVFSFIKFVFNGEIVSLSLGSWNYFGGLYIKYNFLFDALTYVMLLIVVIISFSVQIYSTGYMEKDPQFTNFMAYLALFTFSMLLFVTAGNFVIMFFGWEAVGLCSYLLINFWHTRLNAGKSALKAVIVNKIGDVALLFALAIIYYLYRSFEFSVVFVITSEMTIYKNMLTLMLIIGASAKSAQILLHTWLPDAMEGPTPVSALIHAATMVTAGIFLLIRCSPILEQSNFGLLVCVILGSITAFTAALIGVFQNDIKRIIAYSTCSQLGYLMFVCGLSGYNFAMFHLFNHAFFKALLFLSAGAIIHGINDEQDIRRMGGFVSFYHYRIKPCL